MELGCSANKTGKLLVHSRPDRKKQTAMSLINSSDKLYGAQTGIRAPLLFAVNSSGTLAPQKRNAPHVRAALGFFAEAGFSCTAQLHTRRVRANLSFETNGNVSIFPQRRSERSLNFRARFSGSMTPGSGLVLRNPAPILNQISATAFSSRSYDAQLLINDVRIPFVRAEISAPRKSLGKSVSIQLASPNRAQLPDGASVKFQIGKKVGGVLQWHTIIENAAAASKNYSMSFERDTLSFTTIEALSNRLAKCPKNNLIAYDANRLTLDASELANVPIKGGGGAITTSARAVNNLTLYDLLEIAFVEGCGFDEFITDIPNYEIARCNFTVNQSYVGALAPYLGIFEPEFIARPNNQIEIVNTRKKLPAGFVPVSLTANRYPSLSQSSDSAALSSVDGYTISYTPRSGDDNLRTRTRALPDETRVAGEFPNLITTTTRRKMLEWFDAETGAVLKSQLAEETKETRRLFVTGRETSVFNFDRAGRSLGYTKIIEARLPDCVSDGIPSLLKTREEKQLITYDTHPFMPLRSYQRKIETSVAALLAVDDENKALDADGSDSAFKQDYEKVFKSGNLTKQMQKSFEPLELTVETFRPLPNGQVDVSVARYDFLRDKPDAPGSETRSGDVSVPESERPALLTILKNGLTQTNRPGLPVPVINVGELPLFFAEPLVESMLEDGNITVGGEIEIAGFDESIERGVLFNLHGRADEDLGNFLALAYKIIVEPRAITTRLETLKVKTAA